MYVFLKLCRSYYVELKYGDQTGSQLHVNCGYCATVSNDGPIIVILEIPKCPE